jgi:hypothetical protein
MQTSKTSRNSGLADRLRSAAPTGQAASNMVVPQPVGSTLDAAVASFIWIEEFVKEAEFSVTHVPDGLGDFNLKDGDVAFCLPGAMVRGAAHTFPGTRGPGFHSTSTEEVLKGIDETRRKRYSRLAHLLAAPPGRRRDFAGFDAIWDSLSRWGTERLKAYELMWALLRDFCDGEDARIEAESHALSSLVATTMAKAGTTTAMLEGKPELHEVELVHPYFTYVVYSRRIGASAEHRGPSQGRAPSLGEFADHLRNTGNPIGSDIRVVAGARVLNFGRDVTPQQVFVELGLWLDKAPGSVEASGNRSVIQALQARSNALPAQPYVPQPPRPQFHQPSAPARPSPAAFRESRRDFETPDIGPAEVDRGPRRKAPNKKSDFGNGSSKGGKGKMSGFAGLADYDFDGE